MLRACYETVSGCYTLECNERYTCMHVFSVVLDGLRSFVLLLLLLLLLLFLLLWIRRGWIIWVVVRVPVRYLGYLISKVFFL